MDRLTSLRRRLIAFSAAAVAFLAILVVRGPVTSAVKVDKDLPLAFPGFDAGKAKAVAVSRRTTRDGKPAEESVRLEATGPDAWVVASAHGYPARISEVKTLLQRIHDARVSAVKTTNESRFATYAGTDGFTEVRVLGAGDAPLLSFGVGKGDAEGAWDDTYVRRDARDGKAIVAAKGFSGSTVGTEASKWLEGRLFPALSNTDLTEISVDQREKSRVIELVRGTKGEKETEDPWNMTKPEAGKATGSGANSLVRALTGLLLDDVADAKAGAEADAKYGFDKPTLVVVGTGRSVKPPTLPPTYTVTVGKKLADKDSFYVRRNEEPFVFVVAGYNLQDFRSEPVTLLEKKPEEKKPDDKKPDVPAMGEAPPAMNPEPPAPPAMSGAEKPPEPPAMDAGMDAGMDSGAGGPGKPPVPPPAETPMHPR